MNNRGKDFFREKTEHQNNRGGEDLTNRGQTGVMHARTWGRTDENRTKTEHVFLKELAGIRVGWQGRVCVQARACVCR